MMQGEPLGAGAIGDLRGDDAPWGGAWRGGVRPGQDMRVAARPAPDRPEALRGRMIR